MNNIKILNIKNKSKGFTLIELVIVMLVASILLTIATQSYSSYMVKLRRTEAKNMLYEIMSRQEKYMSENNSYTDELSLLGYSEDTIETESGFYSIEASANANGIADGVILTATPQGKQENDEICGDLILNSNGRKTTSTEDTEFCW